MQNKYQEIVYNPTNKNKEALEISKWLNNLHKMLAQDFHNTKLEDKLKTIN